MYNLGTGKGTSVLEMVAAFESASGKVCIFLSNISVFFPHFDLADSYKLLYAYK